MNCNRRCIANAGGLCAAENCRGPITTMGERGQTVMPSLNQADARDSYEEALAMWRYFEERIKHNA